jgi:hypothetical protein
MIQALPKWPKDVAQAVGAGPAEPAITAADDAGADLTVDCTARNDPPQIIDAKVNQLVGLFLLQNLNETGAPPNGIFVISITSE